MKGGYLSTLNRGLRVFFLRFVWASFHRPSQSLFFIATVARQLLAIRRRARSGGDGFHVPPIIIFSITNRCNLHCRGCFAQAIRREGPDELTVEELRRIIGEADELGVSFVIIAGGEPLMRPEVLEIASSFTRIVFLVVTNGLLLTQSLISRLTTQLNTIPVLSIEGNETETDERRGSGVHERLRNRMRALKASGVFFSLSFTVNRLNFDTVTDPSFIAEAIEAGCGFFLFLEYTPIREGTEGWVITDSQRRSMPSIMAKFRRRFRAVFVAVPWDEEEVGGCLAAGRGFIHISADGRVEACPLAPFSDTSLREVPLRQALASPLLTLLRENHAAFDDSAGGCTLWKERERIHALAASLSRSSSDPPRG